jgi:membrane associated rhomboid family serine protease
VSFSFDSFAGTNSTFPLRGDRSAIVLDDDGIRHPRSTRRVVQILTRYRDITHIAVSAQALWLGARNSVYLLPRGNFENYDAPEHLADALRARVRGLPDGARRLASMDRIDRISENAPRPRATQTLIALCIVIYLFQLALGFRVTLAGQYSPALVADGDVWRLLTANLLHAQGGFAGFAHIALNLLALMALGFLVERPLGSARTACVMGISAVGAMVTGGVFGNSVVVGVSGIVFGLAGSVLWLDYRHAEALPAWWRFPRRSLWIILAINVVIGALLPFIALAAHIGGLISGAVATAWVGRRIFTRPALWIRATCGALLFATVLSLATAGLDVFADGNAAARYAARKAQLPGISPGELNDHAWMIAIAPDVTREELEAALLLAERAVAETHRSEATILDTLAEVQFGLGIDAAAVNTIGEAIALEPNETYYREQRRRFTGERARDDRPDYIPPMFRGPNEVDPPVEAEPEEPGIRV